MLVEPPVGFPPSRGVLAAQLVAEVFPHARVGVQLPEMVLVLACQKLGPS